MGDFDLQRDGSRRERSEGHGIVTLTRQNRPIKRTNDRIAGALSRFDRGSVIGRGCRL